MEDIAAKVQLEKARLIFMQAAISNVVAILISFLYFFVLNDRLDSIKLGIWTSALTLLAFCRLWIWHKYETAPEDANPTEWLKKYTLFSALLGFVWSYIYLLAEDPRDLILIAALLMLYFGVTVAALAVLASHLPTYFLYTVPATITLSITLLSFGEQIYFFLAFGFILFYAMMGLFAANTNKSMTEMMLLKIKNQTLVDNLKNEVLQRDQLVSEKTAELQSANTALYQSEDQLRNVINGANLGYWDWDYQSGDYEVNDRWLEMLGLTTHDLNNNIADWRERVHPDDGTELKLLINRHIKAHTSYAMDFRMKHSDGHWVWIQGSGAVVEYDDKHNPKRLCGTHEDISRRKELEQKLEYQATHDELTGLLNRVELWRNLEAEINRAERYKRVLSVFLIDLDHFKSINDRLGHKAGDSVLRKFTEVLLKQVRKTDFATRYGGEEFVVILPETPLEEAEELAERLRIKVSQADITPDSDNVTISIGIAAYPMHGKSSRELLEIADKAMYLAKDKGRNRTQKGQALTIIN